MAKAKKQKSSKNKRQPATNRQQTKGKLQLPVRMEKSTLIVLLISAVIFFGMIFWINSNKELKRLMANVYDASSVNDDMVFDKATVTGILSEEKEIQPNTENAYRGNQELQVDIKTGLYKGQTMVANNYFGPTLGVPVSVGDSVILTIKAHNEQPGMEPTATVYEFNRIPILIVFLVFFFLVIIAVGGLTGVKSLAGLVFTVICLFTILIPLLLLGAPTILTTFIMCAYIALVSFTILGGIHRKTVSAFLGTVSGAFLAMVFGLAVQHLGKIDGLRLEDAEPLLQLRYIGAPIKLRGLLVASIIISALGAVMDVAMSISSSLEEVHAANPSLTENDLFISGMNIGRDMVGTMTNTLILAFLGSEFTLIIFFGSSGYTFYHMYSMAFVALETISGLSASIGMVLAVPLTALIASRLISKN